MKKRGKLLLLILWMGLIFYMSAQPDVQSEYTSNIVAELIYDLFGFLFKDMDLPTFLSLYLQPIRKLAHFTEFAILGFLVYWNLDGYLKKQLILYSFLITALYACSDEFHQLFVENRYCSFKDVLIDCSGGLAGILLYHLGKTRWKKD